MHRDINMHILKRGTDSVDQVQVSLLKPNQTKVETKTNEQTEKRSATTILNGKIQNQELFSTLNGMRTRNTVNFLFINDVVLHVGIIIILQKKYRTHKRVSASPQNMKSICKNYF